MANGETPEPDPRVIDALTLLAALHRKRNLRPFAMTVNALLEATRAYAGFLLRPGGNQILANVSRIADLARNYETSGGISFRGFVEELADQAEKEEAAEAPVLEEDSSGVRLMTVHAAKGLEFRCVILADLPTSLCKSEPDHYVDPDQHLYATRLLRCAPHELLDHAAEEAVKERAEGMRVAYVAATRARDLLVVPAVGDEPFPVDGWLSPLHKALYPAREDWRSAAPAEGCPEFGQRSIVDRPPDYDSFEEPSVRPGLIQPGEGDHEVVWWDPNLLRLGGEPDYGLRRQELLKSDDGSSSAAYQEWAEQRSSAVAQGAVPEFFVFTASEPGIDLPPGAEIPVELLPAQAPESAPETSPGTATRDARRYGTLVHAILRDSRFNATSEDIENLARLHAKILGAPVEEADAAAQDVTVALAHPVIQAARESSRTHREYPIQLELPAPLTAEPDSGSPARPRLLEGIIDLAFLETDPATKQPRWVIVDFKTSQELKTPESQNEIGGARPAAEHYRAQLAWYAFALSELTGIPARACLLPV